MAEDDIVFLETFRDKITAYLVAGIAPTQDPLWGGSGLMDMEQALKDPVFRELQRNINRMKGRATLILEGLSINCTFTQYPPPAVGGPVTKFPLFNLITDNQSQHTVDGSVFTNKIDEVIGLLETFDEDGLSHNALPLFEVRDIAKSLNFYQKTMAFTAEKSMGSPDTATVTCRGARIMICASVKPTPSRAIFRNMPIGDVPRQRITLGGQTYLAVADPDGNQLLFKTAI